MTKQIHLKYIFLLALSLVFGEISGQKTVKYDNDIGINVTSLLSQVIGLNENEENTFFSVQYRRSSAKYGFRFSGYADVDKKEDSDVSTGSTLTLKDQDFRIRAGIEKVMPLTGKFSLAYGMDIIGLYEVSHSTSSSGFVNEISLIRTGAGPALRFMYQLSDRISLMTESTLYYLSGSKKDVLTLNGIVQNESRSTTYSLSTRIPSVLFINVHF